MKIRMKKTMVASMAMITVLITGVGCSVKQEEMKSETQDKEVVKASESSVEIKKEFTYWLPIHSITAESISDHNDHPAAIRLEEQTGVHVEYINPPVGQEGEQLNLLLASGEDMPDMVRYDLNKSYRGGVEGAISDGVILDATKLIEENAPNYMKVINSDEQLRKGAYTDNGSLAYFGSIIPTAEMRGRAFQGPMINKTLLDKTGLDVPVTIADWEEMLAAFKDLGVKIPFSFGANNKFDANFGAFSGAYGVPMGATFMNENGVVKFGPMESGYKEFIVMFAKWYENGWLDTDFLSKTQNKEIRNDFDAGVMGAAILHINSVISAPVVSVAQGNEINEVITAPYPVLNEGDKLHFRQYVSDFNLHPSFITTQAKNPIDIIQWVDYLYSPEGMDECSWGVKGDERFEDTYYVDETGQKRYTDLINKNPEGLTQEQAFRRYMLKDAMTVWDWNNQALTYEDPRQQEGLKVWQTAGYDWVMPQTITMTLEESDKYSKMMGDITTYVNEMSAKFIMGIEPIENYKEFIETLEKMGIEEVVEIQQAALNRYLAR